MNRLLDKLRVDGNETLVPRMMRAVRNRFVQRRLRAEARRHHKQNWKNVLESRRRPERILFLCYGNICRSPFAERWVRQRWPEMQAKSAGFYAENRSSPLHMQEAASRCGIDLSGARSSMVSPAALEFADVILLLDSRNFDELRSRYPESLHKVLQLGLFLTPPRVDISDPYDFDVLGAEQVCREIQAAAEAFFEAIRAANRT